MKSVVIWRALHARAGALVVAVMALIAVGMGGCVSRPAIGDLETVQIAPGLSLALPRPSDLGQSFEIVQQVVARHGEERYAFEGHLQARADRVLLVGLDPTGRRAMTITWTNMSITMETAPWMPAAIRPENILADMVLLYWPAEVLRRALDASGATVSDTADRRTIVHDGHEVIVADYRPSDPSRRWSGSQRFQNLAWGYELEIRTAEAGP